MAEEVILEGGSEHQDGATEKSAASLDDKHAGVGDAVPKVLETVPERVEGKYLELLSRVTPTSVATPADENHEDSVILDVKHIGAMPDEEGKVRKLLDLANTKGVVHAVKVARSLADYYALDRMHDELAGKLYDGLLVNGLIEKE